uniref:Uncharacterized protein n=1 Tax=viral metagenome TaxID=1070528 RepID=A0A6M3LPX3_9ZZZZ
MNDFEFFCKHNLKWLYILWLPTVEVIKRNEHSDFARYPEAWAHYDPDENKIRIVKGCDCRLLRVHEYGHWLVYRVYLWFDALWEFPWWGLGIRSLCLGHRKGGEA